MARKCRKTPQMVSVNRAFLIMGFFGVLLMATYFYWDRSHRKAPGVSSHQGSP